MYSLWFAPLFMAMYFIVSLLLVGPVLGTIIIMIALNVPWYLVIVAGIAMSYAWVYFLSKAGIAAQFDNFNNG